MKYEGKRNLKKKKSGGGLKWAEEAKTREQKRKQRVRGTLAAVTSYMSTDGMGPYGVRSVSCFRGAH